MSSDGNMRLGVSMDNHQCTAGVSTELSCENDSGLGSNPPSDGIRHDQVSCVVVVGQINIFQEQASPTLVKQKEQTTAKQTRERCHSMSSTKHLDDWLVCATCRQEFPLSQMNLFIQHKVN